IQSSGDYRNPPPRGEHAGLHEFQRDRIHKEVHIGRSERAVIGREIVGHLQTEGYRMLAIAVTKVHAHLLVELPGNLDQVKTIIGDAKRRSSRAVKQSMPGSVWAAGGTYKRVLELSHRQNALKYILYGQGSDAWTWSYRDGRLDGEFGRCEANMRCTE
ncbi:MAG TPA: hypothetical protein VIT43_16375, partial [Candidatus Dormibacteraeota bacterium]